MAATRMVSRIALIALAVGVAHSATAEPSARMAYVEANGLPPAYADIASPVADTEAARAKGGELYAAHCESCHGATGKGDGESGAYFDPLPSDLTVSVVDPAVTDGYLVWTIAEGGKPISSGMNAFAKKLSAEDMWSIIHYMRSAFGG